MRSFTTLSYHTDRNLGSPYNESLTLVEVKPELLETVIGKQIAPLETEIGRMKEEEAKLKREIGELARK